MTGNIRPVNHGYSSARQLTPALIAQAAAWGFNSMLDLRVVPDRRLDIHP